MPYALDLPKRSRRILAAMAMAGATAVFAIPQAAYASSDHELNFEFGGRGRNPGVPKMRDYILGCLPNRTRIYGGFPAHSAGPWDVEVPAVRRHEYTNEDVERTLMSHGCSGVRPAKVQGVTVTDA